MEKSKAILMRNEQGGGQGVLEYGLVVGGIAVGAIVFIALFKDQVTALWKGATDSIGKVIPSTPAS
jgi:Flp pilus assembly pilin Flp